MSDERRDVITLSAGQWDALLESLFERDDRLDLRREGETYRRDEVVDAYVMSGHAEALRSADVDGDVWGTLEDIEETADTEEEAWEKIVAFYLGRECVLVRVQDTEEPEEWILGQELARRLGLL
ncbi:MULTISPECIES: hypothetical protein [unclassified Deinococcus]|uniref:hypothetical protein n=1 Tax=unclassified Deinococcus TaxID=2623546 RepID=UPI0006DCE348|nr:MULTISPECIES: hypothetical protein [unclassified Deinococcus]MCD0158777.1 hypothetical protein [Deinococcus sp. 6GRE01]MCD0163094.1 hypothetical protein [Deinococcus sp. 6YEL10]MCD0166754.1 hypothetical protein [Deinococcus sp. 12RED42]MCD0170720.1 hypothetical protein [Deinococcus sp. 23YEL01]MCD0177777.1 hypothetical protein [Deinococcus sp. 14RED07]